MAVELITGVPGSGKTLFAVHKIEKQVKSGRPCYTDIDGIDMPGVEFFDGDWRDLPDGSFVVFDEVHQRWPGTGKPGRSPNPDCQDLDTHRHRGFDFLLITQWPTKLHHEARTNVSSHSHVVRTMGMHRATIYSWAQAESAPDSREAKDKADSEQFSYPRKLFQHYKSATIHTHKVKIPKKLIFLLFVVLAIVLFVGSILADSSRNSVLTSAIHGQKDEAAGMVAKALAAPSPTTTKVTHMAGCIASKLKCHCYDETGRILEQDDFQCRATMEAPLPFPLRIVTKE